MSEGTFLRHLFARLDAECGGWFVLRNHESLPHSLGGSDLDIEVGASGLKPAQAAVFRAAEDAGGVVLGVSNSFRWCKVVVMAADATGADGWWGATIDLLDTCFRGMDVVDGGALRQAVGTWRGVPVLDPAIAGVIGLMKETLNHGSVGGRYRPAARKAWAQQRVLTARILSPLGGQAVRALERVATLEAGDPLSARLERTVGLTAVAHAIRHHPVRTAAARVRWLLSMPARYFRPAGSMVAVLGADGSGKSTVIGAIRPVLEQATHGAVTVSHLRPGLLPPLARLKGRVPESAAPVSVPHGARPSGVLGSLVRLAWLLADYVLGYWVRVRPDLARRVAIWIFDRHAADIALDPRRFRIALPGWLLWAGVRLAPKPDLYICLVAEPEVVHRRKAEVPLEETRRQVAALREFAAREPRAVIVDTDGDITATRDRVLRIIAERLDVTGPWRGGRK